ncbi:MAG: glycosyltransferase family 4 protein [Actinomycetota bacterium]
MGPLAVVTTHPIQYQVPLFRFLTERGLPLHVFFLSDRGLQGFDPGFGQNVAWDVPLLEGYSHEFVPNLRKEARPENVMGLINPRLFTALSRRRFGAVLVHGFRTISMGGAMFVARARGLPILYRAESLSFTELSLSKRVAGKGLNALVSAFLTIGTRNEEFYDKLGVPRPKRFSVPYAVDNDRFQLEAGRMTKGEARRALALPADRTIVLFAGKLIPVKRPDLLLEAFMAASSPSSQLVFVGDGELRAGLEGRVEEAGATNVSFLGFLNQSQIGTAYKAADLFALPSDFEPWGLVVNEAMNFGLPVVISDEVGCAADLVEGRGTGAVFPKGDAEALGDVLRRLLAEPLRLAGMGEKARSVISSWSYVEDEQGLRAALSAVGR